MKTLKKGSKGDDVRMLQRVLSVYADGIFGEITEEAVKTFQREHGLVADGIVGEKTWDALNNEQIAHVVESAKGLKKSKRRIDYIVVHSTATHEGQDFSVEQIRKVHKAKGYGDIGYHYVIYRDGSLHEGRNVNISGAHARGYNMHSIGVVYVGGCEAKSTKAKDTRTAAQKATLLDLLKKLRKLYPKAQIVGHRNLNATACPSFDAKAEYKGI